jgi:hypothetical protein
MSENPRRSMLLPAIQESQSLGPDLFFVATRDARELRPYDSRSSVGVWNPAARRAQFNGRNQLKGGTAKGSILLESYNRHLEEPPCFVS